MPFNINTSIGYALTTTLNYLRKNFNKEIKSYNLSSEQYAVIKLVNEYGELTPTQIAELFNRDKATVTRIIKVLENKRYLIRNYIDNKSYIVKLTDIGLEVLGKVDKIAQKYHQKIVDKIGEKKLLDLIDTLNTIKKTKV